MAMLRLTSWQDLRTPIFRFRVLMGVATTALVFVVSALNPSIPFYYFLFFWLFWLPSDKAFFDLHGAVMASTLAAVLAGPEIHKYSLAFNVGFSVVTLLLLAPMGFFAARVVAKGMFLDPAKPAEPEQHSR